MEHEMIELCPEGHSETVMLEIEEIPPQQDELSFAISKHRCHICTEDFLVRHTERRKFRLHEFETTEFWSPFCTLCHEQADHPVHHEPEGAVICSGYRACPTCETR